MAVSTITHQEPARVNVGVDTHLDSHAAVLKDGRGRSIGTTTITADPAGYREVLAWARSFGEVDSWGIEGTGSFSAGLARFLRGRATSSLFCPLPK
jgi:transposase